MIVNKTSIQSKNNKTGSDQFSSRVGATQVNTTQAGTTPAGETQAVAYYAPAVFI